MVAVRAVQALNLPAERFRVADQHMARLVDFVQPAGIVAAVDARHQSACLRQRCGGRLVRRAPSVAAGEHDHHVPFIAFRNEQADLAVAVAIHGPHAGGREEAGSHRCGGEGHPQNGTPPRRAARRYAAHFASVRAPVRATTSARTTNGPTVPEAAR